MLVMVVNATLMAMTTTHSGAVDDEADDGDAVDVG